MNRKTDYAVRLLRHLADGKKHSMQSICEQQCIPKAFAYKILAPLKEAGWLDSVPGPKGGCRLLVDLKDVTMLELITLIEENEPISSCLKEGYRCEWVAQHGRICPVSCTLRKMQEKIDAVYSSYTLYDMIFYTPEL